MSGSGMWRTIGAVATILGAGATILGSCADKKNTEAYIDAAVFQEVERRERQRMSNRQNYRK